MIVLTAAARLLAMDVVDITIIGHKKANRK
jgi:hypothetical protein